MWHLTGSKEVSKIDSGHNNHIQCYMTNVPFLFFLDTRNTTVKQLAALKTFPTTIEVKIQNINIIFLSSEVFKDNSSQNKEENLTNAAFDQATYHILGKEVCIETPFLITTNLETRSERAGDREDLILFEIPSVSAEELFAAEKKVCTKNV